MGIKDRCRPYVHGRVNVTPGQDRSPKAMTPGPGARYSHAGNRRNPRSMNAPDWERDPQSVADRLRELAATGARTRPEEAGPDPSAPAMTADPVAELPSEDGFA